jgi:hypothetical protein
MHRPVCAFAMLERPPTLLCLLSRSACDGHGSATGGAQLAASYIPVFLALFPGLIVPPVPACFYLQRM